MAKNKGLLNLDPVIAQELKEKWIVLFIALAVAITAFSLPAFAPTNIYDMLERDFGWSRTEITFLITAKYATGAVVAIVIGALIDKIGVRAILIFVSAVGAAAMSAFLVIPDLVMYYGVGVLLGVAATGTIVCLKVLITRSFTYAAGLAMGITLMGTSIGQLLVPYLVVIFIPEGEPFAWRTGMFNMSLGIWFIALPLLIFALQDKHLQDNKQLERVADEPTLSHMQLFKEGRFWLVALAVFLAGFVDQAFIQNARFILVSDLGIDGLMFAHLVAFYAIAGMISRPLLGLLIDLLSTRGVAMVYTFVGAVSLLALPLAASAPLVIYLWMSLRGIAHSGVMLDSALLAKHCYGRQNLGLLIGVLTGVINIGFATGPVIMAWMYDTMGTYALAFVIYGILSFVAAGIILLVKPTYWLAAQEAKVAKQGENLRENI